MTERRFLVISQRVVGDGGTMERQFQEWTRLVSKLLPFTGDGTPESFVAAEQYSRYVQDDGAAGSTCWIKMVDSVGGDKKLGWQLE